MKNSKFLLICIVSSYLHFLNSQFDSSCNLEKSTYSTKITPVCRQKNCPFESKVIELSYKFLSLSKSEYQIESPIIEWKKKSSARSNAIEQSSFSIEINLMDRFYIRFISNELAVQQFHVYSLFVLSSNFLQKAGFRMKVVVLLSSH